MGASGRGLYFRSVVLVLSFSSILAFANWNDDYLADSLRLSRTVQCMNNDFYVSRLLSFEELKNHLIDDSELNAALKSNSVADKIIYWREQANCIIKKRPHDRINDAYVWELSLLLSMPDCVVPTYPVEIANKKVVIQNLENLTFGSWIVIPNHESVRSVSLEDYWKAHLLAYILGFSDLSGMNIGIGDDQKIRFFDNEDVFSGNSAPCRSGRFFQVEFVSTAFDWPQYRAPISHNFAQELGAYATSLLDKKGELMHYVQIRNIPPGAEHGIQERMELLSQFAFSEGTTFRDFYAFLYPNMASGLDELSDLVGKILNRKIDHGIAVFFATRTIRYWGLSEEVQFELDQWIEKYIPA
ncbi:MAG: hypothetical protein K1000chlam4_00502 [Chlamydiae bacterium]|nr:hypothetical protein [Chlamydiota bacterium]